MTVRNEDEAAVAPAALNAFLRGVERRGALFAELQCGEADAGDEALAETMRDFRRVAAQAPFAEWPRWFWARLLASPRLRAGDLVPHWPPAFAFLGGLGRGPRAALLLRLVAGLAEADAAAVLGVARPTFRLALQRALPHRDDGTPDAEAWRALSDAVLSTLHALPAERLARLALRREAALAGRRAVLPPPPAAAGDAPPTRPPRPRWLWPALLSAVAATAAAFAVTFFLPLPDGLPEGGPRIRVEPLPPAAAPASTFDGEAALLTHRDLDLLLAPAATPAAQDPAFYAWLAADLSAWTEADDAPPAPLPEPGQAPAEDEARSETDDAPL